MLYFYIKRKVANYHLHYYNLLYAIIYNNYAYYALLNPNRKNTFCVELIHVTKRLC